MVMVIVIIIIMIMIMIMMMMMMMMMMMKNFVEYIEMNGSSRRCIALSIIASCSLMLAAVILR